MDRTYISLLALLLCMFTACGSDDERGVSSAGEFRDSDGDGISDTDEGVAERLDSDGDGTPDFEDTDSDNDGIPDAQEARADGKPNMVGDDPADSDADGTPNYADTDSDNNGILDAEEPGLDSDVDGDGIPDRNDTDDDNDGLSDEIELGGIFDPPVDSDNDGIPNFLDPDSDNDGILDGHEFDEDTDGDGLKNWEDPDSDNDGILDKDEEGGDGDPRTPVPDTDGDNIPDFLDLDSDNDGLSDAAEKARGTSPIKADTDGDGVTDLIEVAAETDPFDENDSPRTRGDFVFAIPFEETAEPREDTLNFRTNIQYADMYVLMDDSGSMSGEMESLRKALTTAVDELTCDDFGTQCLGDSGCDQGQICGAGGSCIENPRVTSCIESFHTGFGLYEAYFNNVVSIQPDPSTTVASFPSSAGSGFDEKPTLSLACLADRTQCGGSTTCATDGIGCVGYRADAVKIVINVTDEGDACGTVDETGPIGECITPYDNAVQAMNASDVTYVGINSNTDFSETGNDAKTRMMMSYLTLQTGAKNQNDEPLWFRGADENASEAVVMAVQEVVKNVPLQIQLDPQETGGDAGDILPIIDKIKVNTSGDGTCTRLLNISDSNSDGTLDTFDGVLPGTPVCWDVSVFDNTTIPATSEPQVFRLRMIVRGNDAIVDERIAYFLVPPKVENIFVPK